MHAHPCQHRSDQPRSPTCHRQGTQRRTFTAADVWRDFKDVAKILYVRTIGELQPASQQAHFSPPTPPLSCHPCNTPFWNAAPQQRDMENAWALFTIRLAHLIYNTRQRVVALLALLGQWGQHPALEPARRVAQQVAAAVGVQHAVQQVRLGLKD